MDCNTNIYIFAIVKSIQIQIWAISNAKVQNKYGKDSKKRKIFIEDEKIPLLMKDCECSRSSVYYALKFVTNSKLAKEIRKAAKKKYGAKEGNESYIED